MNIVYKLTLKYMTKNKSRTVVTILGVIISVAMIAATSSIGASFMDMLQRSTIRQTGNWHTIWTEVPGQGVKTITESPLIKDSYVSRRVGFSELHSSKNSQKPYLYIEEYNSFHLSALTLLKGRFPENESELVISSQMLDSSGVTYEIGDTISLEIGERSIMEDGTVSFLGLYDSYTEGERINELQKREYIITGIVDAAYNELFSWAAYTAYSGLSSDKITDNDLYTVKAGFHKLNKTIYKYSEELKGKSNAKKVDYNSELLLYAGLTNDNQFNTTIKMATLIVGSIILLGCVSLIYNAFAISLSERSRTLGMLASVGATKKQKRNSVLFEAFIIGIIAIPIGLVCGYCGIGITFQIITPITKHVFDIPEPLKLVISPYGFMGAVAFSLLLLFISAWFPAKRASKITPVDAIRQTQDINIKRSNVKTSRLTRIIFGFEAELGLKNIKRSKHRYYATLFSMIISIVLFLTASGFSTFIKESFVMANAPINYDLLVSLQSEDKAIIAPYIKALTELKSANQAVVSNYMYGITYLDENQVSEDVKRRIEPYSGKYELDTRLISMDDASLKNYAKEVGIEYEDLLSGGQKGILINTFNLKEEHVYTTISQLNIKPGEILITTLYDDEGEMIPNQIEIAAVTDHIPIVLPGYQEVINNLAIIVPESKLQTLTLTLEEEGYHFDNASVIYYLSDSAIDLAKEIEDLKANFPGVSSYTNNVALQRLKQQRLSLIFSVFLYGFVVLIGLVCMANIMNTISTGVHMRKREFAMLKSYGITPKGFNKMIRYESIFYGLKALVYGLPIGFVTIYLEYKALSSNFDFPFFLPWFNIGMAVISVFIIIGITMLYAIRKTKKDNIIDTLKNENL